MPQLARSGYCTSTVFEVSARIRGVLFDLDGTLLNHEAAVSGALMGWLSARGLTRSEIEPMVPLWIELEKRHYPAWRAGLITFQEQRRRRLRDFLPVIGMPPAEGRLDAIFDEYLAAYEQHWAAYDDAAPALKRVAANGLRVGVLTNGQLEQQTAKLVATALRDSCGEIFASSVIGAAKPDERAYLYACRGLGLQPAQVLMVGDQYEVDVLGARAAGLQAVYLDRAGSDTDRQVSRISSLRDLQI